MRTTSIGYHGPSSPTVIGQTLLERYTIQSLLGEGGMGEVYRATDAEGGVVAIKRVLTDIAGHPELLARFEREASAQSMLAHPNIAGLYAVGATGEGRLFFVMELVEGPTLADVMDVGALERGRALSIGRQVLSALHHAHQFEMVHRDLKPENVLLAMVEGRERAKLIDFGLVKLLSDVLGPDECERLTATGMVFGTPTYMAPEQIMGKAVDPRTDLYATGVLLFEMLTGQPPFWHDEVSALWRMHLEAPVPSLASVDPQLADPELDAIVSTLLAKRPEERFQSAHAVIRALQSVAG